jgi:uncharacterized cupredoxin-like copper-binding protein
MVRAGRRVTFAVTNLGKLSHEFILGDRVCHVLGHWTAGMKGTIVVVAPDRPLPLPAISPPGR